MGNCFIKETNSLQLNLSAFSLEELMMNYSSEYSQDYDDVAATPCQISYCFFVGHAAPTFLAVVGALGLLINLALGVLLATWWRLWAWPPGLATLFQLTLGTTLFAALLPLFASGVRHGWVFSNGLCKAAYLLWYGSLFAEGLLVAAGASRAWWSKWVPSWHHWGAAMAFWAAAALLAMPAAWVAGMEGSPQAMCVVRDSRELPGWWLAFVTSCLAVFILLPATLGMVKVMMTWRRRGWQLRINVTWLFFLLWAPYGTALFLDFLVRRQVLLASCHFYEHLDFFLGLSEGLGILHCCLGPLLLLGAGLYRQKRGAEPGPLGMPGQQVSGLSIANPHCQKPRSQPHQKSRDWI
ncbi:atypical chemokine receptor 1 [Carettochelys insculpta]|uniref:atypical chemokine receptor 1 n=1 Tax=Carettochelys insculpta TaxID=44489 RepID=UPI003EBA0D0F